MGEPQKADYHTIEEYLRREELNSFKSEYENGSILAMSGASAVHNRINGNIFIKISTLIDGEDRTCEAYINDLKVFVEEANSFVYPDVVVVCGAEQFSEHDKDALINPLLIIEVLSSSTSNYDRGSKFLTYASLKSLREYVLIDQYQPFVEVRYRNEAESDWGMKVFTGLDKVVEFRSLNVEVLMEDIYRRVENLSSPNLRIDR